MKIYVFPFIVAASYAAATAQTRSAADVEIQFWRARVAGDADDHISAVRLGEACLRKARETGEFDWYREAQRAVETALARSPGYYRAQVSRAEVLAAQHRFREAIAAAREAVAAQPGEPSGHAVLGDAYLEFGDLDEAARAYARAEELAPGFAADTRLAKLAPEAVALYERAIAASPRSEFFHDLGDTYSAAGDAARAAQWHTKALAYLQAVERGDTGSFRRLSKFYAEVRRDGAEAVKWARRDLELRHDAETYATLAQALLAAGSVAEAEEARRRAKEKKGPVPFSQK